MHPSLLHDLAHTDTILSAITQKSLAHLAALPHLPTNPAPGKPLPATLPEAGMGTLQTLEHFYQAHIAHITASAGPRYWGFVTGGTTPAAIAGDWLCTIFDQNPQSMNGPGDYSARIEAETITLLRQLLQLPDDFNGGFVSGATMSNFTCLAVARQWAGMQNGNDIAREGLRTPVTVLSATPHSSAIKSLSMLGMGSNNIVSVATATGNREAMDMADLENKLQQYAGTPCIVISSAGTVNSVDFDDMQAIAALHQRYTFFWHIDAAFGGFAACSPAHRHLLQGWDAADSIAIDCHKWMNVPYDSAVYFTQKAHARLQLSVFQNSNAPYLGNPEENFSYLNFGPENSRRLRALPAWYALQAYGSKGFEWMVDNNIQLAQQLGHAIENETNFTLAAPVRLNVVCFTTKEEKDRSAVIAQILERLNRNGKVFMTPTVYKGLPCLRAALVNWRTTEADIALAVAALQQASSPDKR
jgi:glutamate/tyrosine decarboxylase-like PLP-dependent enzyme